MIVYDTMWKSTRKMAYAVAKAFENRDIAVRMLDLKANHISDIMTEALTAKYICVGSPTLNNNILPSVAAFLTYLKGLAPKGRTGLAFGSYGWGGQSVAQVEESLVEAGCAVIEKIRVQYVPDENALGKSRRRWKLPSREHRTGGSPPAAFGHEKYPTSFPGMNVVDYEGSSCRRIATEMRCHDLQGPRHVV